MLTIYDNGSGTTDRYVCSDEFTPHLLMLSPNHNSWVPGEGYVCLEWYSEDTQSIDSDSSEPDDPYPYIKPWTADDDLPRSRYLVPKDQFPHHHIDDLKPEGKTLSREDTYYVRYADNTGVGQ